MEKKAEVVKVVLFLETAKVGLTDELVQRVIEQAGLQVQKVSSARQAKKMVSMNPSIVAVVVDDPHNHESRLQKYLSVGSWLSQLRKLFAGRIIYIGSHCPERDTFHMAVEKVPPQLLGLALRRMA